MKREQYKVVVRDKATLAIVEESDLITCADAWISACIHRDSYKKDYDLTLFEVEILEVK